MSQKSDELESTEKEVFLSDILEKFIDNIESLDASLPLIMLVMSSMSDKKHKEHLEFLEKNGKLIEEEGSRKRFDLDPKHFQGAKKIRKKHDRMRKSLELIPRNFIVSLISEFDSFLGSVIKHFYSKKPELLNAVERQLTYADLIKFDDLSDATEYILEKEIESILRKSHVEHFSILEKKFDIDLRKGLESWSEFVEITERRNLFVHCDGMVSSQYIKVCSENGVDVSSIQVGDRLDVDSKYVRKAFEIITEIAVKITHVLWRKVLPNERKTADTEIISLSFDMLQEEEYLLAANILDLFVNTVKKFHNNEYRRIAVVNLSIAYKMSGSIDKCNRELGKLDWADVGYQFKLAHAVLQEKFEDAAKLMPKVVATEELSELEFLQWPLFKEFRESEHFAPAFQQCFDMEPFETESISVETNARQPDNVKKDGEVDQSNSDSEAEDLELET